MSDCGAVTAELDMALKPLSESTLTVSSGRAQRARRLNGMGETRLHIASRLNKTSDVIKLLMEGADINARDYAGPY